jgi:Na+-transporting methylmalonyl-CoA/oxaloacetate decarboxylase gamma subunit
LTVAPVLVNLHEYSIAAMFIVIGVLCTVGMVLTYLFRMMGEVVDSYYDFRAKHTLAKKRFRKMMKESEDDEGTSERHRIISTVGQPTGVI